MEAIVARQFRMESGDGHRTLLAEHGLVIDGGEDVDLGTDAHDGRRPDEDRVERVIETLDIDVGLEALDLGSVRVAPGGDVDGAQRMLIRSAVDDLSTEQNQSGAGPERRETVGNPGLQRLQDGGPLQQHRHGGRLATGQDDCVDVVEGGRIANLDGARTSALKDHRMSGETALEGQNANGWSYQPRSASLVSS